MKESNLESKKKKNEGEKEVGKLLQKVRCLEIELRKYGFCQHENSTV